MTDGYYMDAQITPARSLSPRGLKVVMTMALILAAIPALVLISAGLAFLVPIVGIDILGLWLAFHIMNRRVDAERVRVSSDFVEVQRSGKTVWTSSTAFTRVEPGETTVRLAMSGRRMLRRSPIEFHSQPRPTKCATEKPSNASSGSAATFETSTKASRKPKTGPIVCATV